MDVANLVIACIAMVAACVAAYFAMKAPTQEDLKRVEDHLAAQNRRDDLLSESQRVSMCATAEGWADQNFTMTFKVSTPEVILKSVELTNKNRLFSGAADCIQLEPRVFTAEFSAAKIGKWYQSGDAVGRIETHAADLRVIFELRGQSSERVFQAVIVSTLRLGRQNSQTYYLTITGEC